MLLLYLTRFQLQTVSKLISAPAVGGYYVFTCCPCTVLKLPLSVLWLNALKPEHPLHASLLAVIQRKAKKEHDRVSSIPVFRTRTESCTIIPPVTHLPLYGVNYSLWSASSAQITTWNELPDLTSAKTIRL